MDNITFKLDEILALNKLKELREELQEYVAGGDDQSYMDYILEKFVIIETAINKDAKAFNDFIDIQCKTMKQVEKSFCRLCDRVTMVELELDPYKRRKKIKSVPKR